MTALIWYSNTNNTNVENRTVLISNTVAALTANGVHEMSLTATIYAVGIS